MSGFFPDDNVRNPGAGDKWLLGERDKAFNEYLDGASPRELGIKYKQAPKAFQNSILNKYQHNYLGRAERYEATRHRVSRVGRRWTQNELEIVRRHKELKLPADVTARLLCRLTKEVEKQNGTSIEKKIRNVEIKSVDPIDLIWAFRYAYFGWGKGKEGIISDEAYDTLVQEECEYGGKAPQFQEIKAQQGWPEHIRSLALYLSIKIERAKQEGKKKK